MPVRWDPFKADRAYAYVPGQWNQCVSEHHTVFYERTERELMIASGEIRRRYQQHNRRFTLTARMLADFLTSVDAEQQEVLQRQRLRDAEGKRVSRFIENPLSSIIAEHAPAPRPGACMTQKEHVEALWRLSSQRAPAPPAPHWHIGFREPVQTTPLTAYEEVAQ